MENKTAQNSLDVRNLRIGYARKDGELQVTGTMHFGLAPGMLAAIIGVNGVGKSTLLRTLGGMQPALSGSIRLLGEPAGELSAGKRARIQSIVLTAPPASRNLTVRELVSLGRHPYTNWLGHLSAGDREVVSGALGRMELKTLADRPCHTLSDGQLQRALIARALAQDTPIILLDEPTTHLDLYHKVRILKGLGEIAHHTGKAIIFTTHEIDLAIQLCDRILVLEDQKTSFGDPCALIEAGAFESLFPQDTIRFDAATGAFRVQK